MKGKLPVVGGGRGPAPTPSAALVAARLAAGMIFLAAVPVLLLAPSGMRLFWTVAIAALPALFVFGGFYLWRRICPLALAGQLGRLVGRPGGRKAGPWLAANYPLVQLGVLGFGLWARLVATNGTPWALAAFLGAITAAAVAVSLIYTGKSWCNYFCPVGLVEKLYTEPVGRARGGEAATSQCAPCTACKKNCPDIDQEQGYWKEMAARPRQLAYFAWPGVVLAFYGYYYACSGGWGYYFSGEWTRETAQAAGWLGPGFHFAPAVPRAVAAALTLLLGGVASFALLWAVERGVARLVGDAGRARHVTLAVAGFAAFALFYLFAGQPTLAKGPWWLKRGVEALVIAGGAAVLLRRLGRSEQAYVTEKFARGILRRWEWGDAPPSTNLADVALIHAERQKQRDARLAAYKETLRELVADGVLSRGELHLVTTLRRQLGIGDKEHEQVLSQLTAEEKRLFDPAYQGSVEQRLSMEQYRRDLERILLYAAREGLAPDEEALEALRHEHRLSREQQLEALRELRGANGPIAARARELLAAVAGCRRAARAAARAAPGSRALALLQLVCRWRAEQLGEALGGFLALLRAPGQPEPLATEQALAAAPPQGDAAADQAALRALARDDSPYARAIAVYLLSRFDGAEEREPVAAGVSDEHPLVRETAVRVLGARGRLTRELVTRALEDKDGRVRRAVLRAVAPDGKQAAETATGADPAALAQTTLGIGSADPARYATLDAQAAVETLSTLEKMIFLVGVPLLAGLDPDDLELLSGIAGERRFDAGADLCREGDRSDEVFVLASGRVRAHVRGQALGESSEGACIGEMAALDQAPRSATVTAVEETRALVLAGADFRRLIADRPAIALGVLSVMSGRLRGMIQREGDR